MKYIISVLLILYLIQNSQIAQTIDTLQNSQLHKVENHFDPDVAAESYINSLSAENRSLSDRYTEGGYWHTLWALLIEIVVAIIFLFFGLSKWMKKISMKVKNINLQNFIYIVLYFIFSFLLVLPYSIYKGFIREHRFGLSNMSFSAWFGEELLGLVLNVVLLGLLLVVIYYTIRKTKERWWIWAGGISTVFIILMIFISPVFLAPLFNEYKELSDGQLKDDILSLARANGIPADKVYQYNASKQSKGIGAHVSGIGKTIRISLNDNLLNRCSPAEIKAVMAHEMGHYVLNHVQQLILLFSLMFFIGLRLLHISFQWAWKKWGKQWNITGISDIGGLPLLMALISILLFLLTPLLNNLSRQDEVEADIFGLNAAREPDGFASVSMMTSEYRKTSPGHWEEILLHDHPSPHSRVVMAMRWKAENLEKSKPEETIDP